MIAGAVDSASAHVLLSLSVLSGVRMVGSGSVGLSNSSQPNWNPPRARTVNGVFKSAQLDIAAVT